MAKQTGLNCRAYVHGYDISGEVSVLTNAGYTQTLLEVPTLTKLAVERLIGVEDGSLGFNTWFDPASDLSHDALLVSGAVPTADRVVLFALGAAIGDPCIYLTAKQANYNVNRSPNAAIEITAGFEANAFGLDFGIMLTAHDDTFSSLGFGTSFDMVTVSTTAGASAVVELMSLNSGTVDFDIQDSADNSSFADITDMSFVALTARGAERLETASGATIRRYVRLEAANTFTTAVVAVGFRRG